ncbi:MAG: hypothetical protein ACRD2A_06055 [Vicinamibacterales bacterium]
MTGRVLSMTPGEFAFTLTVPRDLRFAPIVRDVAAQVVTFSAMDAPHAKGFVDQVAAATERVFGHGHHGGSCEVRFVCEHGEVRVTMAGEAVRQRVAS